MGTTRIEWAEHSINPIRAQSKATRRRGHYCTKISPGCANCYAERWQNRFGTAIPYTIDRADEVELYLDESTLDQVRRRRKPTIYFWFDMTDPFHELVPFGWLSRCLAVMRATRQHRHLLLTKRPARMRAFIATQGGMPGNLGLGVSVEDQQRADERVLLLRGAAGMQFVSVEPMLGPVKLFGSEPLELGAAEVVTKPDFGHPRYRGVSANPYVVHRNLLDWVIIGCESGPKRRPWDWDWVGDLLEQCHDAGVPAFVKQVSIEGRVSHDPAEWPTWARVRQWPEFLQREIVDG